MSSPYGHNPNSGQPEHVQQHHTSQPEAPATPMVTPPPVTGQTPQGWAPPPQHPQQPPAGWAGAHFGQGQGAPPHNPYTQQWGSGQQPGWGFRHPHAMASGAVPTNNQKHKLILGLVTAAVIALALAAVFTTGLIAPGWMKSTRLNADAANRGVTQVLTDDYGLPNVSDVACDTAHVDVATGKQFTCTVNVDGHQQKVINTFIDDKGKYEVGKPS